MMEHKICIADRIKIYINAIFTNLEGIEIITEYGNSHSYGKRDKLHIDEHTRKKAEELYLLCRGETVLNGKNPATMAISIVYIACVMTECHVTQKQVAESIGMSEVTLRNGYKYLRKVLKL